MNRIGILATSLAGALLACGTATAQPRSTPDATALVAQPVTDPAQIAAWLARLAGRFRFEGMVHAMARGDCGILPPDPSVENPPSPPEPLCQSIRGMGDCVAIGKGPGVQCVLDVSWRDMYEVIYPKAEEGTVNVEPAGVFALPGGVSYLDPAMALFGIDPGRSQLNYLLVDDKGLPEGGMGSIAGNRATFRTTCVNAPVLLAAMKPGNINGRMLETCDRIVRIDAKPDASLVFLTIDIEINEEPFTRLTLSLRRVPRAEEVGDLVKPTKK